MRSTLALLLLILVSCTPKEPPRPITLPGPLDIDPLVMNRIRSEVQEASKKPGNPELRSRLAFAYDGNGLEELAIKEYEALEALAPRDPLWPFRVAVCKLDLGRSAEGQQAILAVTEAFPRFAPAWHRLALLSLDEGNLAEARNAIDRCLESSPLSLPAKATLGDILLRSGEPTEAASVLEDVTRAAPDDLHAKFLLGRAYQRTGRDGPEAIALIEAGAGAPARIVESPRERLIRTLRSGLASEVDRSISLILAGRPSEAVTILERALVSHPDDPMVMSNLAQAHNEAGAPDRALSIIARAAELAPKNFRVQLVRAKLELSAGDAILAGGRATPPGQPSSTGPTSADRLRAREHYETALAASNRATRFAPQEWRAHFDYARAAHRCQQLEIARASLIKAQEIVPLEAEVNQFMFEICWQLKDADCALAALERVVAVDPNHLVSWVNLVHVRIAAGDLLGAQTALTRAQELNREHPRVVDAAMKLIDARKTAESP